MKNLIRFLGGLLFGSAVSLSVGGAFLYFYGLVPVALIELTAIAVAVILVLSFFVLKGNNLAINVSTALGALAPLFSLSVPAHIDILLSFGANPLLSILGLLQFIGFDLFPITFVVLRITFWRRLTPSKLKPRTNESKFSRP